MSLSNDADRYPLLSTTIRVDKSTTQTGTSAPLIVPTQSVLSNAPPLFDFVLLVSLAFRFPRTSAHVFASPCSSSSLPFSSLNSPPESTPLGVGTRTADAANATKDHIKAQPHAMVQRIIFHIYCPLFIFAYRGGGFLQFPWRSRKCALQPITPSQPLPGGPVSRIGHAVQSANPQRHLSLVLG